MRQFFETYRNQPKLSALLRELPWTLNLLILGKCILILHRSAHAARISAAVAEPLAADYDRDVEHVSKQEISP
jgi:hypothetical protein